MFLPTFQQVNSRVDNLFRQYQESSKCHKN